MEFAGSGLAVCWQQVTAGVSRVIAAFRGWALWVECQPGGPRQWLGCGLRCTT